MYGKDRTYKKVEIIGVSGKSIEAAVETALLKARASLDKLSWFEIKEIHGHIGEDGKVAEYQVLLKVAFELKDKADVRPATGKGEEVTTAAEGCDIRVWCPECKQSDYTTSGDKYLCRQCGKILNLDHRMHQGHIEGDYDKLS